MTSFISSFKPLLFALALIAAVEVAARAWWDVPQGYNSDMMTLAPLQKERITSVLLNEKLNVLGDLPARYIQVGDSSGFYGVKPSDIRPQGDWLNYSCCARAGFEGYRRYAAEIVKRQRAAGHTPEYLVLAMTPYYAPLAEFENSELAEAMEQEFAQWWRGKSWLGGWRLLITNLLYRGEAEHRLLDSRVDKYWGKHYSALTEDLATLPEARGWMERPGKVIDLPKGECAFAIESDEGQEQRTLFRRELERMAAFAREQKLKLALVINPVACKGGADAARLQADLDDFQQHHPEVIVPFGAVRVYPAQLFKDQWHLSAEGAARNSRDIKQALGVVVR